MSESRSLNPLPTEFNQVDDEARVVRAFLATEAVKSLARLLDAVDRRLLEGLRTVGADQLACEQGKLTQLAALRELLRGGPSNGMA